MGKPAVDGDEAVFLELSRELKDEGVRLFNRRDYEGAAFKYDKAAQLLPSGRRVEAAQLRASIAQCYMRMSPGEYHRAIHECNLALEAAPRYSRALLRRASCFEALGRPDLAWRDVETVLRWEPGNRAALEISRKVRADLEAQGVAVSLDGENVPPEEGKCKKSHNNFDSVTERQRENHVDVDNKHGNYLVSPEEEAGRTKQDSEERHMVRMELNGAYDMKEKQADQRQINGIGIQHMCGHETNGLQMQENNMEKKEEKDTDNKRSKYSSSKKKTRLKEGKQKSHSYVKSENHVEDYIDVKGEKGMDVKLVFGEDIRCAQIPPNCSLSQLRQIVQNKFPSLKALLIKYKDKEHDLVTITRSEELRWAHNQANLEGPMRLYVVEVDPIQELGVDGVKRRPSSASLEKNFYALTGNGRIWHDDKHYVDGWMVQFAQLFKNHVGFSSDAYLDLHEIGIRFYYEAMEDTIDIEDAQEIFQVAELKFQEMAALSFYSWGNVHMSRARKRPCLPENASLEFVLEQVKISYEWVCTEYAKAGAMFQEAVKTKGDFFEGLIAIGQQQFEQAKLSWYYSLACKIDMGTEVLELFNHAEDNMEKGMDIWERKEILRLRSLCKPNKEKVVIQKMELEGFMKDLLPDEAFQEASNIRSHINILWATILYERSVVEFNLGLPSWEESLGIAMEKFKIGGASLSDINVIVKNHCANETTKEGLSFKVEEIVQAWNEMYDAKNWQSGATTSRLQPIFQRRAPKLHHILEHLHYTRNE
ncbi:hypothetical protein EJB05_08854, partial [Eragrostis curvula]